MMSRKVAREIAVHLSFGLGFSNESAEELLNQQLTKENFTRLAEDEELYRAFPDEKQMAYIRRVVFGVAEHGYELDCYIEKYSIGWRFERIPRTATAIMRVAMFEVLYMPEIPNAAAINEAITMAKGYEDEKTVSFINGVLGAFVRGETGGDMA